MFELQVKPEEAKARRIEANVVVLEQRHNAPHISSTHSFDIAKAGGLVQKFDEADPDLFFIFFEC